MVEVYLRAGNNLINLIVPGKVPIRGRTAPNQYFHTPLEILLSACGLCVGSIIVNYCKLNDINIGLFESITMDYKINQCCVEIRHGKTLPQEHMFRISKEIEDCPVSRELKRPLTYAWWESDTPVEELVKKQDQVPCCGG